MGVDNSFNMEKFKENFKITNVSISDDEMEAVFDVVGIDPPIANALRRIMIAEVRIIPWMHVTIVGSNDGHRESVHLQQYWYHAGRGACSPLGIDSYQS